MEVVSSGTSSLEIPGYRILKKINQGGMSTVYLAVQRSVGRQVALKVMSPVLNADPIFSERFQREANIVGQLSHPNIVAVHDIGRYRSLNYIAMDYMPGGSVSDRLARGMMDPIEALNVARQIALALDHAHGKGYVHRDLKPENILFREDGSAVLTDFGVARAVARTTRMTNTGMVVGTPHYMSPEQARGAAIDGRADLYSLGVVFYEMVTNAVPYQADEAVAIAIKHLTDPIPRLPARHSLFQGLIDRLLAKDPADRFQRGLEVVDAIDHLLAALAGKPTTQATQLSNTAVGPSSLIRALLMTLWGTLMDKAAALWALLRDKPLEQHHPRAQQDTIMRIQQVIQQAPQRTRRQWFASSVGLALLATFALVYAIWGDNLSWPDRQAGPDGSGIPVASRTTETGNLTNGTVAHTTPVLPLPPTSAAGDSMELPIGAAIRPPLRLPDENPERVEAPARMPGVEDDQPAASASTGEPALEEAAAVTEPEPVAEKKEPVDTSTDPAPVAKNNDDAGSSGPEIANSPERLRLRINPQPGDALVRIMNIGPRYRYGMALEPGSYDVEVSKPGYRTVRRWISLKDNDLTMQVKLKRGYPPGSTLRSPLASGGDGPEMVVVKAGTFRMGNSRHPFTSPIQRIRIAEPFAISAHEITFDEYDRYADATGAALPGDGGWGRGDRPVINVTWEDARAYARWLSRETGKRYRLPSEAEWEYAARAGSSRPFWWGVKDASGKANCRRGCASEFVGLFRARSAPVGHYPANAFGLHDTAGNVAEWVEDCYVGDHSRARRDGSPVRLSNCDLRVVKGGSMRDPLGNIGSDYRQGIGQKSLSTEVGFRVLMELD
ncbi:bifunctional serine/threonine-protein kinase/formylglycine-generating enzyme family protein [Microbulbifer guangxiensis]|uniref:bifunctional serine/threonine-protein kinase/formylglycine-generating enzyme family protein n=1 Tax=Microbulbifer guangxiensis TaxID=2904249 RepID=UPI001F292524|nr:bifunctional serine/threonine-protein kinase/formylglycine-generating enzyme family protein [Microbulbifer guangxiensis]